MKTAIKLILIYLGIQLICGGLIGIPFTIIARMNGGSVDATRVSELTLAPSMLLSMAVMFFYLWKAHYIPKDKTSWSFISFPFLIITFLIGLSMTVLMDLLTAVLSWVPDILEQQFDALQSGWLGIVAITLLGPILEELLFRGGATKALLERYSPESHLPFGTAFRSISFESGSDSCSLLWRPFAGMGLLSDTKSDSLYPDTHCEQQYFCHAESDLSRCRYNQGCDGYDSLLSIDSSGGYGVRRLFSSDKAGYGSGNVAER